MTFVRVMRVCLFGIIIASCGVIIAACAPYSAGASARAYTTADSFEEMHKTLSDGRNVTCLAAVSGNGYAISCDWANAR